MKSSTSKRILFTIYTVLSLDRIQITVSEHLQIQQQIQSQQQQHSDYGNADTISSFNIEVIPTSCGDRIPPSPVSCMARIVGPKLTPGVDNDTDFLTRALKSIHSITFNPYKFTFIQNNPQHFESTDDYSSKSIVNYTRTSFEVILDANTNESSAIWHGVASSTSIAHDIDGHASFVIVPSQSRHDDAIFDWHGSFTTQTAAYSLTKVVGQDPNTSNNNEQRYRIVEKKWSELPDEQVIPHAGGENSDITQQHSDSDILYNNHMRRLERIEVVTSSVQHDNRTVVYSSENESHTSGRRRTSLLKILNIISAISAAPTIDILLLVTNRAVCELAGQPFGCDVNEPQNRLAIENRVTLMESQSNLIFVSSGAYVRIRILRPLIYLSPTVDVYTNTSLPLLLIENNENATQWREEYKADLVGIITASSVANQNKNCGIARQYVAGLTGWASATDYTCLDSYSFQHQIGHNLGCYHNRADSTVQHAYAHGWQIPAGKGRTIMAEDCKPNSCPRYPYYSNNLRLRDLAIPIGNNINDNSRRIRENAATVAAWKG